MAYHEIIILGLSFDVTIYFSTMSSIYYKDCRGSVVCSLHSEHVLCQKTGNIFLLQNVDTYNCCAFNYVK